MIALSSLMGRYVIFLILTSHEAMLGRVESISSSGEIVLVDAVISESPGGVDPVGRFVDVLAEVQPSGAANFLCIGTQKIQLNEISEIRPIESTNVSISEKFCR